MDATPDPGDGAPNGSGAREILAGARRTGEPCYRVWRPGPMAAFGRRDTHAPGYAAARAAAEREGYPVVVRQTGGRPVVYTASTVAFALAVPAPDMRTGVTDRYEAVTERVQRALWRLGVPAERGEPPQSFCPGDHSLQYRGKIAGLAQFVTKDAALIGGVVVVRDHAEIARVLERVYDTLGVPFDPDSVGSIARAGGRAAPDAVVRTLKTVFDGDGVASGSVDRR